LAAHVRVKAIRWIFTPVSTVFAGAESFSNPRKDDARKTASRRFATDSSTDLSGNQLTPM
jgi:hypothetical protein